MGITYNKDFMRFLSLEEFDKIMKNIHSRDLLRSYGITPINMVADTSEEEIDEYLEEDDGK